MVTIATCSRKQVFVSMKSHVEGSVMWGLITIVVMLSSQCIAADVCDPKPCKNEGTCTVGTEGSAECACPPGWGGNTCEDAPKCTNAIPCENGGTCKADTSGQDICFCAPGFGGDLCADASCVNNPCQNGGTCKVVSSSTACTCDTSYGGERCELAPKCTDAIPCENGGTCKTDTSGQDICFCASGFGGDLCADASGAAKISVHVRMLAVVAVLTKLSLN